VAGRAARRPDACGVSPDRHDTAVRAQRIFLVFHLDRAAAVLLSSAAWLLLTVLQFLSYKIFINYRAVGDWQFDPFFQWLCYAPFYVLLAWEILRRKRTIDSPDVGA